ncbi:MULTISPECIES: hypothetical protein, partial [unclassified Frankia]|uniref:hypothetical protein n=1 Tax=unclassified Frankia TaxID=2632575 RepID=UPI002AD59553
QRVTCADRTTVPAGQPCPTPTPGSTCPGGALPDSAGRCPQPSVTCPGGLLVPAGQRCPQPPTPCPTTSVRTASGRCTPTTPGSTPTLTPRSPVPGELLLDHPILSAGDTLIATGAGCGSGAPVVITSDDNKIIGQTTADSRGRFSTVVQFATYRAGHRTITASCGAVLRSGVDMVLTSSSGGTSNTFVLLLFFLLAGSLVVRRQIGDGSRSPMARKHERRERRRG